MTKSTDSWETIAKASELPSRSMKHIEIKGKEIAIINLDGKYYAINDRCGHMNAPLSKGEIRNVQGKDIVTCPPHFSTFDIVTGKKLSEPKMSPPMDMVTLPKPLQDAFAQAAQIMAFVKTYDMETFEVEKDRDDDIKLKTNS
jgi:nitrite reductase/ring-hydroxylating ferredoxin subunit